jgi:hypothetical protein
MTTLELSADVGLLAVSLAINPVDGEKLFVESCLLVVVVTTVWAWRYRLRKDRQERALKIGSYRVLGGANASD